ncbi:MAG: D-sedoheptulose 7-phosphate isomerase [Candidatus Eisenbacteria bacterium]|uniref:Phosphoheptose isomerase n=1 Tax=Eiseniibacteriota bacterium TaxID=2212470 RepID=A0A948RSD0_UNCEI|nr:D-sedoheptulose 7-phosphate isomerase [Candidatus Eisenbacteria bacterium]MBU1948814.1 D-sedoheptulose 7-phosphate isomerase [Candidatus Eisenbacteria bacterium]MBU2689985.1 D-sedoheptulose 7-phosphate isomerase [Candidatus Eisenbacteria bacterium]
MIQKSDVEARFNQARKVQESLLKDADIIKRMSEIVADGLRKGNKVLFFGNGGSAADAQHLACELAGRFYLDRPSLPALALSVNTSSLTAIGNDFGFQKVFSRQIEGIGSAGDVAVAISTSGNSPNVIEAVKTAKSMGIITLGFTGQTGGELKDLVDECLIVATDETPRVQEGHILAGHIICELAERELFGKASPQE